MTTLAIIALVVAILLAFWVLEEIRRHDRTKRALARRDKALDELLARHKDLAQRHSEQAWELQAVKMQAATHICEPTPAPPVSLVPKSE